MNRPSDTPVLEARGLGYTPAGRAILSGIDFRLAPGEVLGIVGPNGAGKSTLLRCLAGLLPATGSVQVAGRPLASLPARARARAMALMHQDTRVAFPLPVGEVVMLGRHPHLGSFRSPGAADRAAVERAMAFTDTAHLAGRRIDRLSGGERQRVLFARALAQDTPVLLLDEPTASLDIAHQEQIFGLVARRAAEGAAVVAAVHDLRLASRWCDRLLLLAGGRLAAAGTPAEVLTPARLEAAYGVKVRVWDNPVTGLLDFHVSDPAIPGGDERPHVHVIGGGGSAAGVLRLLGDAGWRITAGVLSPGDSDLQVAGVYGIPVITAPPFSAIGDDAHRDNCELAARAELTVLCSLCIGAHNLRNLEAALSARRLVVIEDDDPASRDFSGGIGLELYRRVRRTATVLHGAEFPTWLQQLKDGTS